MKYVLVIDASQGERKGADSFAACVAHEERRDGQRLAVQDALYEAVPPFSPQAVIAEIALLARRYDITRVHGDAHARGFVAELLREHGLTFAELERDKSALYLDALAMLNSGQAVLLDHPKQRRQILSLRRALHSGGRVSVDHQRGGHDDVANVGLAALVVAFGVSGKQPRRQVIASFGRDAGGNLFATDEERQRAREARTPGAVEVSIRRQERLERLLSGQNAGFAAIRGGRGMTAATWDALTGGESSGGSMAGGGPGPFERGDDARGPFRR